MSAILLENDLVHYEVLGRGRPVFFLHGWFGSWRYWLATMQSTSLDYRSYALDFWGFGDSVRNGKYQISDQARLINDFCEKMGIFRVALIGHGIGAVVALSVARQWPDMVDRVMAIACPLTAEELDVDLILNPESVLSEISRQAPEWQEDFRFELAKIDPQAVQISLDSGQLAEITQDSPPINAGCLYVHGHNDRYVKTPSEAITRSFPENKHAILFEQSGHFPFLEESSKFTRLLSQFLALESGDPIRNLSLKEEWQRRIR